MVLPLGWNNNQKREFRRLLRTNHWINVTVQILDLEHKYMGDVSNRLVGGQVNIKAKAEICRSATLELFDPTSSFDFISESPSEGALFLDRMVRIVYSVAPPDKSVWYDVPIFCGPMRKIDRDGFRVIIEANGKEVLAQGLVVKERTYKEGFKKTTLIRTGMRELVGESARKLDIPDLDAKTGGKTKFSQKNTPWQVFRKVAASMHRQFFYDGRGQARLRKIPESPAFTFTEDMLLSDVEVGYNMDTIRNSVIVVGKKPRGSKKKVKARVTINRKHPLSPRNLGRNDVPRYLTEIVNDNSLKTVKACRNRAREILHSRLKEALEVKADILPVPHLEELDVIRFNTKSFKGQSKLQEMTIPLTASGTASLGYLKRTDPKAKKIRRKRSRRG